MTDLQIALALMAALLVLIVIGLPTAIALFLTAFAGLWLVTGDPSRALKLVADQISVLTADPQLAAIPFFLLMSLLLTQTKLLRETADAAVSGLKHRPDGPIIAMIAAHALATAVAGMSMTSTIAFTSHAATDLKRHGYPRPWIGGALAGASILGLLAPASLLLIAYALLAGQSISKQLIAGAIPSLMMAAAFVAVTATTARHGSTATPADAYAATERGESALPGVALTMFVLGGLYSAVISPLEASALGATSVLLVGLARQRMDLATIWRCTMDTAQQTAAIVLLLLSGLLFAKMLTIAGFPNALVNGLTAVGLGKWGFLLLYVLLIMAVASLLDVLSLIAIVVPLTAPVATRLGVDPLQCGVITVLAIGCGMLAPPFGMAPFTVKAMLGDKTSTLEAIFANAAPYLYVTLALLCAVAALPWLSLALIR
jgi:C4-dicarboxylate transporter, DctM subunit